MTIETDQRWKNPTLSGSWVGSVVPVQGFADKDVLDCWARREDHRYNQWTRQYQKNYLDLDSISKLNQYNQLNIGSKQKWSHLTLYHHTNIARIQENPKLAKVITLIYFFTIKPDQTSYMGFVTKVRLEVQTSRTDEIQRAGRSTIYFSQTTQPWCNYTLPDHKYCDFCQSKCNQC